MGIDLAKGQKINLSKEAPSLQKIGVGLGWDENNTDSGNDFDLDTSVFMLNSSQKLPANEFFIFYNNLKSPDGSTEHTGDNLTGDSDGDDETIYIDLTKVDTSKVSEMVFIVTIHEADQRNQNFGQVRNSYIRLYDLETNKEIAKYELDEDFSIETALEFGRLYLKDNAWRFGAVGTGYKKGLQSFVDKYVG